MTMTAQEQAYVAPVSSGFRPLKAIKTFFQIFGKSVSTSNEYTYLSKMSEQELAKRGLKRETIPEYVISLYFSEV